MITERELFESTNKNELWTVIKKHKSLDVNFILMKN